MDIHEKPFSQEKILSFDDFVIKCRMMDEACRQWCAFIDDIPERRDGELFTEFYEDICKQKYNEYMNDSGYRDDCNYSAEMYDAKKAADLTGLYQYATYATQTQKCDFTARVSDPAEKKPTLTERPEAGKEKAAAHNAARETSDTPRKTKNETEH